MAKIIISTDDGEVVDIIDEIEDWDFGTFVTAEIKKALQIALELEKEEKMKA